MTNNLETGLMKRPNEETLSNGWLVVDKCHGPTSATVVKRVKNVFQAKKVGHSGTLDPFATGVLPLAFGEATKTIPFIVEAEKKYKFTIRWGVATDTDDLDGSQIGASSARPSRKEIESALPIFCGKILQMPPQYSAVKIKGKRAYQLARQGKTAELTSRAVFIREFRIVDLIDRDQTSFEVVSGKGVYIRALARDLAKSLGTLGHVSKLRRVQVGPFSEKEAISLDQIEELGHKGAATDLLWPSKAVLDDIPALALIGDEPQRLRYGQFLPKSTVWDRLSTNILADGNIFCAMAGGDLVALVKIVEGQVRPVRVFNL